MQTAKLNRKCGPYSKGRVVTTDPEASTSARRGPLRVDPERYARWQALGYLEPLEPEPPEEGE